MASISPQTVLLSKRAGVAGKIDLATEMSQPAPPAPRSACLTEAEVARVRASDPGGVPQELAMHLAGCERCQERALFGPGRKRTRREVPRLPSPGRTLFFLVLMLAAIAAFLYTLQALVVGL
jgi:hypothetical protein